MVKGPLIYRSNKTKYKAKLTYYKGKHVMDTRSDMITYLEGGAGLVGVI